MTEAKSDGGTKENSFVLERTYDAPRERVYLAWTNPDLVALWWGIEGSSSIVHQMDVRPSGAWSIEMRLPNGSAYPNRGIFRTVVEHKLLEYSQVFPFSDGAADEEFLEIWHRVAFRDAGNGRTSVHITVVAPTSAVCQQLLRSGMADGMSQGLDRLGRLMNTPQEIKA